MKQVSLETVTQGYVHTTFPNDPRNLLDAHTRPLRSPANPHPRERAVTDLGAALRRAGQPAESRAIFRHALDLADRHGALALTERSRTERVAAGRRNRPRLPMAGGLAIPGRLLTLVVQWWRLEAAVQAFSGCGRTGWRGQVWGLSAYQCRPGMLRVG
jgi:hypothetical protein